MSRVENHTKHCEVCASGYAEHCYEREAAQEFDELTAEREALRKRIEGVPDDDWQGMYHIAAKRAQVAEDALAAVRKAVQASEVKPLPPGTYYTEHVEHATKISEARRLALVEIRGILGLEVGK